MSIQEDQEVIHEHREPAAFQSEDAGRTEGLERIHLGAPEHFEVMEFLEEESGSLDDNQLLEWFDRMAPDILYRMPVRTTRDRADGSEFSESMFHFDEDYATLGTKVTRLAKTASAWAEKPPSRTRRFVTNIKVFRMPAGDENDYEVRSSVFIIRNRYQESAHEFLSVRRTDRLRKIDGELKITSRMIFPDQATMGMQNLAIFI